LNKIAGLDVVASAPVLIRIEQDAQDETAD
jgi:hypothetical protein